MSGAPERFRCDAYSVRHNPLVGHRVECESVFRWWDFVIFAVLSAGNLGFLVQFLGTWLSYGDLERMPLAFIAITAFLSLPLGLFEVRWFALPLMRRPRPMPVRPGWRVGVATTFVPGAESISMLEHTVQALVAMRYPHETWVLDEGDDPSVRQLCARLGARHFSRKGLPQYQAASGPFQSRTKHGNYNAWLQEHGFARYDIVVAFDPDHVPLEGFLLRVLGYFDDPRIGYVQAAQVYYNQPASLIARGAAEETYAYYSSIQMVAYALGYPIITGCHNAHRVSALREIGGFAPHEADDLATTVAYRAHGWRGVYLPLILARGLTPVDWAGYLGQQRRWARSVLDVKVRIYPRVAGRLPFWERAVSLAHGLYYLEGLAMAVQIVLLAGMLVTGAAPAALAVVTSASFWGLVVMLQACDLYRQRFYLDPRREIGVHWRQALLRFGKWPWVLAALVDVLRQRWGTYPITRKVGKARSGNPLARPHLTVAGTLAACWIAGALLGHPAPPLVGVAAAAVIAQSLVVVASGYLPTPEPYDPSLAGERALAPVASRRSDRRLVAASGWD